MTSKLITVYKGFYTIAVCVCMLGYIKIYFHCSGSSQVCLAHRSLLAQDSNSARGKYLEMSHISPGHTHSAAYVHILLNLQQYVRAFQSTLWASGFQTLLQTLPGLLFASASATVFDSFDVKRLQLIIVEKHPGNRAFYMNGAPSQVTN